MRKCEILRDKQKAIDCSKPLDPQITEMYIQAYQCPYCRDGRIYKMLPLHIYQIHGITAYEFKRMLGLNRKHSLASIETSERMSLKKHGLARGLVEYYSTHSHQEAIANRYKDGGQRQEAIVLKKTLAQQPEWKQRFTETMSHVDRKAVAAKIPPSVRKMRTERAVKATAERWARLTPDQRNASMTRIRSLRTPESEARRRKNAQATMKQTCWSNPEWRKNWRTNVTQGIRARAKMPRSEYPEILRLHESGLSELEIAQHYNNVVHRTRIGQILGEIRREVK